MGKGQYLHGVLNTFPSWHLGEADSYSAEALAILWLVMAVLGRKLRT